MKKNLLAIIFIASILFVLLCVNCSTEKATINLIKPPVEGVNVAMNDFLVDPSNGDTLTVRSGTSIIIPPDCFVDVNGNLVSGEVQIEYREFHNSAEIILSGIPMVYDSAGEQHVFQSAGMFEINGFSNNQPVFIKEGKEITVNMGSYAEGDDYNFYYLDEEKGNWNYEGRNMVMANLDKERELDLLNEKYPENIEPRKANSKSKILDFNVSYSEFPELRTFHAVMWEYAGYEDSEDPELNSWVYNEKWSDIELEPQNSVFGTYKLKLKSNSKSFTTTVVPVLTGSDYRKAMKQFRKEAQQYKEQLESRKDEESRLKFQADMIRSFSLSGFGIYNWDRQYKIEDRVALNASFSIDGSSKMDNENLMVYLITGDDRAIVKYSKYDFNRFAFSPSDENKLVAVLPGKQIAVFKSSDFKRMDVNKLAAHEDPSYTFNLRMINDVVKQPEDLLTIIQSI